MNDEKQERKSGIQVIARATAILRALSDHPGGMSLAAIAAAVELPRSTVQRIIYALEVEKLVESLRPGSGYRLGPALGMLSQKSYGDIVVLVRKELQRLCHELEETVALSCIRSHQICVIDRVLAETRLGVMFPLGYSLPGHSTSDGKILLSTLDDETIAEWIGETPELFTEHTLNKSSLLAQFGSIRQNSIAEDHEEHAYGICSVSTLIATYMGMYAITIVSPKERYFKHIERYRLALLESKTHIEAQLSQAYL